MTEFYSTGTVAVTADSVDFVGTGTTWLPANVKAGDVMNVAGRVMVIAEISDATHGKFAMPYPGGTASGQSYAVVKTSAAWGTNREIAVNTAELIQQLAIGAAGIAIASIPGLSAADVQAALEALKSALDDFEALPTGGATGQVLAKLSATDFDAGWASSAVALPAALATSGAPSHLDFAEQTTNGTNKVTVQATAALGADRTFTLPDVSGTAVVGVLGSTDNRLVRVDGAGGATVQASTITVDDSGNVSGVGTVASGGITAAGTSVGFPAIIAQQSEDGASQGPFVILRRISASPAANDALGYFGFQGMSSTGVQRNVAFVGADWVDPTNGAETGRLSIQTINAGSSTTRATIQAGLLMAGATGGDKGVGTINATAVYDDNTLLTCMALQDEFLRTGDVDLAKWDALVPDRVIPGRVDRMPATFMESVKTPVPVVEEIDGRLVQHIEVRQIEVERPLVWADPIYDVAGNIVDVVETPIFDEVVTPDQVIPREHELAHRFKAMIAEGFDPRDPADYVARLRADGALPGMPTMAEWKHGGLSSGELFSRLWLATEMLAIVVINLHERVAALET